MRTGNGTGPECNQGCGTMIQLYAGKYDVKAVGERHRQEHELGMRLLRFGLEKEYGIKTDSGSDLSILKGEHGKPCLKAFPHIHYNISHTEGLVICALGEMPLGLDVEKIHSFKSNICRKVLSEKEQEFMETLSEEKKQEYFFRYWTLKESYVKAIGCGITIPLTSVSFEIAGEDIYSPSALDALFWQEVLENQYMVSLCVLTKKTVTFDKMPFIWVS